MHRRLGHLRYSSRCSKAFAVEAHLKLEVSFRGVMARKGDTPEYVRRMQKELFEVLGEARSRAELRRI